MKITVTKKDISWGLKDVSTMCPIALAVMRIKRRIPYVHTTVVEFYSTDGALAETFALSKKARTFISRFDAGKKVKPFSFNLNIK